MKCSKCGHAINEEDAFCGNCGEKIVKEVVENDKKTNKKLFVIFAIEIVLVILIALDISSDYRENSENEIATPNEFRESLTQKGYSIEDFTKESGTDIIKSYDFATIDGQDLSVHYIVVNSSSAAIDIFNYLYYQISSRMQNGFISEYLIDNNYYFLENSGFYYVISRKGDTVFFAMGREQYEDEFDSMVEEFGFEYPASALYFIVAIAIFVFILMTIAMWKIFVKAGVKGWKSLIPFYNYYCLSKITFNKGWLFIFMLITPINIVFMPVTFYKLAKKFGKSTAFAVCSIFFPYVTMQIIAFDNSKYNN